ncbi:MAG: glycosyltransferase family 39 protein [Deltaproteobacteria bacterium]|nr:glycosyltransferase family 39 protein [Deltaproteobacteria bacterium]
MNRKNTVLTAAALAVLFIAGCALRLVPWPNFITQGGVYFLEADNYEHLRKVLVLLKKFPFIPPHDFYMGFPVGTGNIWAPLTDFSFTAIIKAVALIPSVDGNIIFILAALPPFVGMLAIIPLFLWARECFDTKAGLVAALLLALLPSHIFATVVGRPDNELFEPLWAAITFYFFTLSAREAENERGRKLIYYSAAAGVSAALSILYWRGALIWWPVPGAYYFFMIIAHGWAGDSKWVNCYIAAATAFSTIAAFIALVLILDPFSLSSGMQFNVVSWFHVVAALLAVMVFSAVAFGFYLKRTKASASGRSIAGAGIFLAVSIGIFVLIAPGFFRGILEGLAVIGGGNKWTSTIAQYKPLLRDAAGRFSFKEPLVFSSAFLLIAPLTLLFMSIRFRQLAPKARFFLFAGWMLFVITLINGRYENVFALIIAISGAVFLCRIYGYLALKKGRAAAAIVTAAVLLAGFLPSMPFYRGLPRTEPFYIIGELEETLVWVSNNTPPTSNFLEPSIKPEYGIMAQWEFGGWIEAVAKRPSVATVMGTETHGMKESAEFFLASDEREFLEVLDKNGARYFILSKMLGDLPDYARLLGKDPEGYVNKKTGNGGEVKLETGQKFFDLINVNLYLNDGQSAAAPIPFKSVPGVRLVYESASPSEFRGLPQEVKKFKIFERVKGAILKGSARPGEGVAMAGMVQTNRGRRFFVTAETTADNEGVFYLNFFYPNIGPDEGKVGIVRGYVIQVGNKKYDLRISEQDILEGNIVTLEGK